MIVPFRRFLLAACLTGSTAVLAQIPPQGQRPTNPNAMPPPGGASGFNRPRPGMPITPPGNRPSAARPGAAGQGGAAAAGANGEERVAIKPEDAIKADGGVELQFPNTPISQILLVYEDLTGLKIIRDANAEQATVSIETTGELPKDKAILFIEKSLLLNGYSFVPAGDGMVKLLAFDAKKPQTEGAPLFEAASDLPETDQVVSFVALLKYLNPEDAVKAIDQIIPRHSYGVLTPVPNAKALIIVENSNTIRSILALLERLDVKPGATITKRIQLVRSDAEDVKKALDEILGLEDKSGNSGSGSSGGNRNVPNIQQPPGAVAPNGLAPMPGVSPTGSSTAAEVPPKILAIPRTNRLLVMAMPDMVATIETLVEELDAASELRTFVSRPLKYLDVEAAMGIIGDAITRTEGEDSGSGGSSVNSLGQSNNSSTNSSNRNNSSGMGTSGSSGLFGNSTSSGFGSNSSGGFGSSSGLGGSGSGFGGGGGFSGGGGGGNLQPLRNNNGPRSLVIGKTLLISDPTANSLFASGPPEHLRVLNEILDELDRRPQQILLSAVIGEVQLTDNKSFGIEWLFRSRHQGTATGASSSLAGRLGANPNGFPVLNARTPLSLTDLAAGNGLAFYGALSQNVDVIVSSLDSYSNFKVISRPSIFTMNNMPALISSGQSFPIATSTQGLVGGGTNNGLLSNVQYQDVALSLNIVPLINSDDELTLQISQENSEAGDSTEIAGNEYPVLTKQLLNTVVMCKNRSTVLLGGLIREGKSKSRAGVPILSEIPVLNVLTGSRSKGVERRELLIFIEPRIVTEDNLPPSVHDSVGNSPAGREFMGFMDHEKRMYAEPGKNIVAVPPVREGRLKTLVRKLFRRDASEDFPTGLPDPP